VCFATACEDTGAEELGHGGGAEAEGTLAKKLSAGEQQVVFAEGIVHPVQFLV
jgi:hypothetical protein